MVSIEYLKKIAEMNLCQDCFWKYKAIIEPSIKAYLSQPLSDFRQSEAQITQIVMKIQGVFKGKTWILSFRKGEEEKVAEYIDLKAFRKIENTLLYIQLEEALFQGVVDYISRVAKTEKEVCELVEDGFEFVCDFQGHKVFRKSK